MCKHKGVNASARAGVSSASWREKPGRSGSSAALPVTAARVPQEHLAGLSSLRMRVDPLSHECGVCGEALGSFEGRSVWKDDLDHTLLGGWT
jgi:hypothetical protein